MFLAHAACLHLLLAPSRSSPRRWLNELNTAFEESSPAGLTERGQSDRLWRMLYHLESGEPG